MRSLQFTRLASRVVALLLDDVDTDQIIPARYLKVTDKEGLGDGLFASWRYDSTGQPDPDFPLNYPEAEDARILLTGRNFGCGSSREHATWALLANGYQAVIAPSFADIFRSNSLKNGLLVVELASDVYNNLVDQVKADPTSQLTIDLSDQTVTLPDGRQARFPIDGFTKHCLIEGIDSLGYLLGLEGHISAFEATHG
jgi:3-isopropylmalate/(R)-2-methylmalate dehydratase small subunit